MKLTLVFLLIAVATFQVAFATYHSSHYSYYCRAPRRPDYGGYKPYKSKYPAGYKLSYYCDYGYKLYGYSYAVCKYDKYKGSYWSYPPPVCKKTCPKLYAPKWGKVWIKDYTAYYSCNYGYELYGSSSRKCSYGKWGGYAPVCKPKKCPRLYAPKYGKVWVSGDYSHNSKAHYSCNYGYKLYGPKWRKCNYGYWEGKAPVCKYYGGYKHGRKHGRKY